MYSQSTKNLASYWRDFFYELLFPKRCIICNNFESWCCADCAKKITHNLAWRCAECHQPSKFGSYCPRCQKKYHLDGLWVSANYDNADVSLLIKAYKYKNIQELKYLLGLQLNNFLQSLQQIKMPDIADEWLRALDDIAPLPAVLSQDEHMLIPVPLHPRRWRWRGFNQSLEMAKLVDSNIFNFTLSNKLVRKRYQRPQAKLNKKQRQKNLRDAFAWTGPSLQNKSIILIDDVASTGTTLNECAKVLKRAGAKSVWGLVLAQG